MNAITFTVPISQIVHYLILAVVALALFVVVAFIFVVLFAIAEDKENERLDIAADRERAKQWNKNGGQS